MLLRTARAKSALQAVRWGVNRSTRLPKLPSQLSLRTAVEHRTQQRIRYGARSLHETAERNIRILESRVGRKRAIAQRPSKPIRGVPFVILSHTGLAGTRRKKGSYGYRPRFDYLSRGVKQKTKALRASRVDALTRRKSPYTALKVIFEGITPLNARFKPRLQKRSPARAASSLSLQQRLCAGALSPARTSGTSEKFFAIGAKTVMCPAANTKLFRNSTLKIAEMPYTQRVISALRTEARMPAELSRFLAASQSATAIFPQPNFLEKVTKLAMPLQISTTLQSHVALTHQNRHYKELQFYHRRPRTRLPGLAVTRMRRRKGGFVTFARNSLKRPRTLAGREHLLLPPANTYSTLSVNYSVKKQVGPSVFAASPQHEDA